MQIHEHNGDVSVRWQSRLCVKNANHNKIIFILFYHIIDVYPIHNCEL